MFLSQVLYKDNAESETFIGLQGNNVNMLLSVLVLWQDTCSMFKTSHCCVI